MTITYARATELFCYDEATGVLTWKRVTSNRVSIGDVAGSKSDAGYLIIGVDGDEYRAHHIVWLLMTGNWPVNRIDHENLDKADNRYSNLREATQRQNLANTKRPKHNRSGVKGVYWDAHRQKWHAQISIMNKSKSLGRFDDIEGAKLAYATAAVQQFGEFARLD